MRTTLVLCLLLGGCSTVGRIKTGAASIFAVPDNGKPATLDENHEVVTLPLPAGTRAVMTSFEAMPGRPATETSPAVAPQAGRTVTEFIFDKPSEWKKTGTYVRADTGTVDNAVAKHRIDSEAAQPLLIASIACVALAVFFAFRAYPTPAIACGIGAVIFFMQWQMTSLPSWFKMLGITAVVGGVVLWVGHRRGERDGVNAALAGNTKPVVLPID